MSEQNWISHNFDDRPDRMNWDAIKQDLRGDLAKNYTLLARKVKVLCKEF
jgi:hypothetical protein